MTRLAAHLDLSVAAVSLWERVPPEHCLDVEDFTGVSRHVLRPDIFGDKPASKRPRGNAVAA